jgi:hypothetical protein
MTMHRLTVLAALGLVLAALGAPAASAQQDLRNPDTRDGAEAPYMDFRNPDTRGMADSPRAGADVTVVEVPKLVRVADGGLDWGDAGIGAGGMLGLVLLVAGSALAIGHRKAASSQAATAG